MPSRAGVAVVAALVILGAALVLLSTDTPAPYVEAGTVAPEFRLADLESGEPVPLSSYRGRVVLLNFWATWCKPCEDEMPSMEALYRSLAGQAFELVAVSVDDDVELVRAFRSRHGLSFPILLDPARAAADAYQTFRFPETFLIDAEGRVIQRYVGPRDWSGPEYANRIRRLVTAGADPVP